VLTIVRRHGSYWSNHFRVGEALQFSIGLHKLAHDLQDFSGFTSRILQILKNSVNPVRNKENE